MVSSAVAKEAVLAAGAVCPVVLTPVRRQLIEALSADLLLSVLGVSSLGIANAARNLDSLGETRDVEADLVHAATHAVATVLLPKLSENGTLGGVLARLDDIERRILDRNAAPAFALSAREAIAA